MHSDGSDIHIFLWAAIDGIVEIPRTSRSPANLIDWGRASFLEWGNFAPFAAIAHALREDLSDQDIDSYLPHL